MPALPSPPARKRLRRRLLIALGVGSLGLFIAMAALPWLVGTEFVKARILARINQTLAPGRLEVDRFEVFWTSPTRLVGFMLIAPGGERVAEASVAEIDRSLGQFLFRPADPTTLSLDRAALTIARNSDGKIDLVETLRSVINQPNPKRDLTIRISNGSLVLRSEGLAAPLLAQTADLDLHIPPAPLATTWNLKLGQAEGGQLVAKGDTNRWTARNQDPSLADLHLDLEANHWPITRCV